MKRLICTLIVLRVSLRVSAETLSFELARSRMLQNNGTFAAAREGVLQALEDADATRSLHYPFLTLNAQHIRMNDAISIDLNPIRSVILALHPQIPESAVPSFEMDVQNASFNRGSIEAKWPLFAGGRGRAYSNPANMHCRVLADSFLICSCTASMPRSIAW